MNTCENSFFGPHLGLGRQKNDVRLGQTPDVELPYLFKKVCFIYFRKFALFSLGKFALFILECFLLGVAFCNLESLFS